MEADSRFEGVWFKTWQGNESLGSLEALSEENDQNARKSWISTGLDSGKSLQAREFLCLGLLKALAALTLLTDSLTVRLQCLFSALPCSLPKIFSLFHFPQRKSKPTLVLRAPAVNPGRESELRALCKHFLRKSPKSKAKSKTDRNSLVQVTLDKGVSLPYASASTLTRICSLTSYCSLASLSFSCLAPFSVQDILTFQLSLPGIQTNTRFEDVPDSCQRNELLALETHFLRKLVQKQGKYEFRLKLA
ncbi:Hypothetical_protein [Hexamita inflata]|uniref:Hypothetical_protein n=1 Tax=Hexamita inflata TaxID=28002 RepID=A0AA86VC60_9EUKA|nr:Hypothetical protein HINF_LOCUS50178 [Hexamita inflata]